MQTPITEPGTLKGRNLEGKSGNCEHHDVGQHVLSIRVERARRLSGPCPLHSEKSRSICLAVRDYFTCSRLNRAACLAMSSCTPFRASPSILAS